MEGGAWAGPRQSRVSSLLSDSPRSCPMLRYRVGPGREPDFSNGHVRTFGAYRDFAGGPGLQPPYCSTAISIASPTRPRTPSPFRSPIALPSYHPTHDSSAPRRALAGEATEAACCARGRLAPAGRLPGEPAWLASAGGAVHRNTVRAFQFAIARRGGPGGPDAAVSSSPCPHRRPASGVQCPMRPVSGATSVHACLSSDRCPVSGAGV